MLTTWYTLHNNRLVRWLNHCLSAFHCYLELTDAPMPPEGVTRLGTTGVVQVGCAILAICRGTGQSKVTYWAGYWDASGN
jgi:hypothetical protein